MTEFESEKKNKTEFHEATQAKQIKKKNKIKSDKSLYDVFTENKSAFYGIIFYAAGLLCGAFIYKKCQTDALNELISASASGNFTNLFINNLGFYFLAFAAAVVLGLCLVGFPFINLVALVIGLYGGINVAYYYINYGVKGFGYSLLMIAPFICSFLTVIIFTISLSYDLSKKIYDITVNKSEKCEKIAYGAYIKKYALYAVDLVGVSLINAAVVSALSGLISL